MMGEEIKMITYCQMLQELKSEDDRKNRHLLLGNGFNVGLGVGTTYEDIFKRMIKEDSIYEKIALKLKEENYDVEKLIGILKEYIKEDSNFSDFLGNYIENKVKFDFMKSASSIVREKIQGIYQDKNEGIYILLENFFNYFTLNYDTFLYLILMRFKKTSLNSSDIDSVAFQQRALFEQQDLDQEQNEIYTHIKQLRYNGEITIGMKDKVSNKRNFDLENLSKADFETMVKNYNKKNDKKWKPKTIKIVCNKIWEEEKNKSVLEPVNDGFKHESFKNNQHDQNIFFLHGSFHIYKDRKKIKKITQKHNKALYERLGEIIDANRKDIICVLTSHSQDKINQIKDNEYLNKCFDKLSKLSGVIVILGSSLDNNDSHIFDAINKSKISKIYIAAKDNERSKSKYLKAASKFFSNNKKITLFNRDTISYNID